MATYEYTCDNNHVYVDERPMKEDDKVVNTPCEICEQPLKRIWDSSPTIFKGRGFYSTGG